MSAGILSSLFLMASDDDVYLHGADLYVVSGSLMARCYGL